MPSPQAVSDDSHKDSEEKSLRLTLAVTPDEMAAVEAVAIATTGKATDKSVLLRTIPLDEIVRRAAVIEAKKKKA